MMYRDVHLLNLARGQRCLLNCHPQCMDDEGSTTVAAHSNWGEHGKGKSIKAEDSYSVWACWRCHQLLDQGMTEIGKKEVWLEGYERQKKEWQKLADNPTIKPWRRETARRVLDHIGVPYGQDR
jgi:hypothetical protein